MKLLNIGFGNMVSAGRIVAVIAPDSAPVKRMMQEARETSLVSRVRPKKVTKEKIVIRQSRKNISPPVDATPLPPLKCI